MPVDDLTVALPKPATAPARPGHRCPCQPVTARVPVAVPPTRAGGAGDRSGACGGSADGAGGAGDRPGACCGSADGARGAGDRPGPRGRPPAAPTTPVPARAGYLRPSLRRRHWPRCWRGCLDVEQVSVDAHFFDDLGADSMVMARFCARARKRDDLPSVSIKDVYRHPTMTDLAAALAPAPAVAARRPPHPPRLRPLRSPRRSRRCWRGFWTSSRCRSMRTSSTTWVRTRW